jgi:tetratricopeptide (TPR) repeat protein
VGQLSMPLVPDGPIRRFYQRLHELHAAAGRPSTRQLQRATRGERRPAGINPTTIHDAFSAPRLARWEVVQAIVAHLGGDLAEFELLWRQAREAQVQAADLARVEAARTGAGPAPGSPDSPGEPGEPGEPGPARAATVPPAELPPDVFAFTGRDEQLKWLDELLDAGDGAAVLAVLAGTPGVGKTALAVHWAHRVRDRFPAGQLYVDLRGHARGTPVPAVEVLAQFLGSLGVPAEDVPADQAAAGARYRSLLADRRMLVLLDNAAEAGQVRPLLPASPGCLVLVTSRDRLSGLVARDGARRLGLDVLGADEAQLLLARILGAERVAAEPAGAAELARACAHLPLALRLAAANLLDHPARRIEEHAARIGRGGLALLDVDGDEQAGVRPAFDLSYHGLPPGERRLFRLAGLVPGPDLTPGAAGALIGTDPQRAGRLLERLAAAHLLAQHLPDRYTSHDLLREYAADRALAEDGDAERAAALERLFGWYLSGADRAAELVYPHRMRLPVPPGSGPELADGAAALSWLDAERENLVAAVGYAADHGPGHVAWLLADTLRSHLWLRMRTVDLARTTAGALRAARAAGDLRAQATTLLNIGNIDHRQRRYARAIEHISEALALAGRAGWVEGQATAYGVLATAHRDAGEMAEAAEAYLRALALYRGEGLRPGEALALSHLGRTYWYLGRLGDAVESATAAVALYRTIGSRLGEAAALNTLGEICQDDGRPDQAIAHLQAALAVERELGDRGSEAYTLRSLAEAHRDRGELAHALRLARTAVVMAGKVDDVRIEADAVNTLGTVHHRLGRDGEAVAQHRRVLDLVRSTGDPFPEIQAHLGLAAAYRTLGEADRSRDHGRQALARAERTGFRMLEQRARAELADPGYGVNP